MNVQVSTSVWSGLFLTKTCLSCVFFFMHGKRHIDMRMEENRTVLIFSRGKFKDIVSREEKKRTLRVLVGYYVLWH